MIDNEMQFDVKWNKISKRIRARDQSKWLQGGYYQNNTIAETLSLVNWHLFLKHKKMVENEKNFHHSLLSLDTLTHLPAQ